MSLPALTGSSQNSPTVKDLAQLGRFWAGPEEAAVLDGPLPDSGSAPQVLRAMAGSKSRAVRQQFMQLHVLDMLVRELSLEYEAQQVRPPPAARLTSSTSSSAGTFQNASSVQSAAVTLGPAL